LSIISFAAELSHVSLWSLRLLSLPERKIDQVSLKLIKRLDMFRKYLLATITLPLSVPVWAAGPENPLYSPLAMGMICIMIVLLIAIAVLAKALIGKANTNLKKWQEKKEQGTSISHAAAIFLGSIMLIPASFGQDAPAKTSVQKVASIGSLSATTFYVMATVILLQALIMVALAINIRLLTPRAPLKQS